MTQREHFAHQNCELIRCHTLNKIRPFICFGSTDFSVWRRHAMATSGKTKKTALPLLVWADELIWLFVFIYYTLSNLDGCLLLLCCDERTEFGVGSFSCLFSHSPLDLFWYIFCIYAHLICTNGVNSTVIRLGHFISLSRSFHFLFISCIFPHFYLPIPILNAFWSLIFGSQFFLFLSEHFELNWTSNFSIFQFIVVWCGSVHCHLAGKQKCAKNPNDITYVYTVQGTVLGM